MKFIRLTLCCALMSMGYVPAVAHAESYELLEHDRLLLRAMRWDPVVSSFVQWDGVSGEYKIGPDGTLMVPLAGQIQASGNTLESLSKLIETRLRRQVGLAEPPHVAIEVIDHLPVYVLGDVTAPGAYPFRPGLTAQQALALAGGPLRPPLQLGSGNDFQTLSLGGEIRLLTTQIAALENERERLTTDLDALSSEDQDATAEIGGLEGQILAATQTARSGQGVSLRELQEVQEQQIKSLEEQLKLREEQIEFTRKDLESVNELKERGLAVNARVTALNISLSNLISERLNLEIALLNAKQQLNRAQRDELALVDTARSQALTRLNQVEQELLTLRTRLATAQTLHNEVVAAGLATDAEPVGETVIEYSVTRESKLLSDAFDAVGALLPGDTLVVSRTVILSPNTE